MARITSPYLIADVDQAYLAYCKLPLIKSGATPKMGKRDFRKKHAVEHPLRTQEWPIREARGETHADLIQALLDSPLGPAIQQALGNLPEIKAAASIVNLRSKRETDSATNGMLWRLNVEGLLTEAVEASPGDYITKGAAQAVLTDHFGEM